MEQAGKAYSFFDCRAKKGKVSEVIDLIRIINELPSELELRLEKGFRSLKGNGELEAIAQEAKKSKIKYLLEATYPQKSNRETADELVVVMNQMYNSPLYKEKEEKEEKEKFRGEIVYEEGGRYIFME